jgi:hypothetical protein
MPDIQEIQQVMTLHPSILNSSTLNPRPSTTLNPKPRISAQQWGVKGLMEKYGNRALGLFANGTQEWDESDDAEGDKVADGQRNANNLKP